jgi:4-hydroxybenzoate polyprenyltransferase
VGYDTIYALQDIEDDALAGIKSSARRLGGGVRLGTALFYAATSLLVALAMLIGGAGWWSALIVAPALHFLWQIAAMNPAEPRRNLSVFKANVWPGAMIALAVLAL